MNPDQNDQRLQSYPAEKISREGAGDDYKRGQRRQLDERGHDIFRRYETKFALRHLYEKHNAIVLDTIGRFHPSGRSVLEIGAAFGNFVVDARRQYEVTGLEHSFVNCQLAGKLLGRKGLVINADGENLAFRAEAFDVVLVKGVVAHFGSVPKALGEIKRVLKPGGIFILMEGVNDATYRKILYRSADLVGLKHDHGLFEHLTSGQLLDHAAQAGFALQKSRWVGGLFDPLAYLGIGGRAIWIFLDAMQFLISKATFGMLDRYYSLFVFGVEGRGAVSNQNIEPLHEKPVASGAQSQPNGSAVHRRRTNDINAGADRSTMKVSFQ